ncbi:MAG TPA: hypothetical protein VLQ80_12600 [Candidatus Saccharimonadia bacterium]|nr:hypothetical protein [Candidatus Saccharimonadia bacterium]
MEQPLPCRATYATVMTTAAARLRQTWQDGATLDMTPAMMRVTLAIAAKTLLDADVEAEATAIGRAIRGCTVKCVTGYLQ